MSSPASRSMEHREALLAARALGGLDPEESAELAALLGEEGEEGEGEDLSFELAVAALDLAYLPADLAPHPLPAPAAPANDWGLWLGWVCAAAGFALAAWSYATRPVQVALGPAPIPSATLPVATAPQVKPPTLAEQRAELLAEAKDVVSLPWTPTKDPTAAGASGDVVWSDAEQKGFMRFKGLAVNDPDKLQYQLWIFDPTQDKRYPVDGGVFDIDASQADPATGEVIVPIVAKLRVRGPTLFAVTVEKQGGVVVSSRERIALLANTGG